jgi:hypothetical protein
MPDGSSECELARISYALHPEVGWLMPMVGSPRLYSRPSWRSDAYPGIGRLPEARRADMMSHRAAFRPTSSPSKTSLPASATSTPKAALCPRHSSWHLPRCVRSVALNPGHTPPFPSTVPGQATRQATSGQPQIQSQYSSQPGRSTHVRQLRERSVTTGPPASVMTTRPSTYCTRPAGQELGGDKIGGSLSSSFAGTHPRAMFASKTRAKPTRRGIPSIRIT